MSQGGGFGEVVEGVEFAIYLLEKAINDTLAQFLARSKNYYIEYIVISYLFLCSPDHLRT